MTREVIKAPNAPNIIDGALRWRDNAPYQTRFWWATLIFDKLREMFSRLLFAGVLVIIIWLGLLSNSASSQQVESRINNLEADFRGFESRLSRIEAQLNQSRQSPSLGGSNIPSSPSSRRSLSPQERERMFDRLATLVVELKQQVNKLEQRVSKLESR